MSVALRQLEETACSQVTVLISAGQTTQQDTVRRVRECIDNYLTQETAEERIKMWDRGRDCTFTNRKEVVKAVPWAAFKPVWAAGERRGFCPSPSFW